MVFRGGGGYSFYAGRGYVFIEKVVILEGGNILQRLYRIK